MKTPTVWRRLDLARVSLPAAWDGEKMADSPNYRLAADFNYDWRRYCITPHSP